MSTCLYLAGGSSHLATRITPFRPTIDWMRTVWASYYKRYRGPIDTELSVDCVDHSGPLGTLMVKKLRTLGRMLFSPADKQSFRSGMVFAQPHAVADVNVQFIQQLAVLPGCTSAVMRDNSGRAVPQPRSPGACSIVGMCGHDCSENQNQSFTFLVAGDVPAPRRESNTFVSSRFRKNPRSGSGQREKRDCPEGEVGRSHRCRQRQAAPVPAVEWVS